MYPVSKAIDLFAVALIAGLLLALLWANIAPESYADFVELRLADDFFIGYPDPGSALAGDRTLTLGYLSGNVLMSLFFLYIGKELWEAVALPGGSLHGRRAVAPLIAAAGAMLVPVALYLGLSLLITDPEIAHPWQGWPVPLAGDVALSYILGRRMLGADHPALRFLMLVAITCDVTGLVIAGVAFPVGALDLRWLALPLAAAMAVWILCNALPRWLDRGKILRPASRFVRRLSLLPYAVAGAISWYGVQQSGLSPALGLLPILPVIPHTDHAFGLFAEAETLLSDLLNRMARLLVLPVAMVLFLFALTHAGAPLNEADVLSLVVLAALLIGKPLGILAGARIARALRFALPPGVRLRHMPVIGLLAALGLTVPVFATETALPDGLLQDGARIGLIATLVLVPLLLALMGLRQRKQR